MTIENKTNYKYILKALEIGKTDDAYKFLKNILSETKLHICIGDPLVGKTALSYKLLHCLLNNAGLSQQFKSLYIRLQEKSVYDYLEDQIQAQIANKDMQHAMRNIPFVHLPYADFDILEILKSTIAIEELITANRYNFIIFDGFNFFDTERKLIRARYLAKSILRICIKYDAHILINFRNSNKKCANIFKSENAVMEWTLTRPKFLNDECKEFGDCILEKKIES